MYACKGQGTDSLKHLALFLCIYFTTKSIVTSKKPNISDFSAIFKKT